MGKLTLIAAPTFKAKVGIPIPGAEPVDVEFTFKHRTKSELDALIANQTELSNADAMLSILVGWELEAEFNAANVEIFLQNYMSSAPKIINVYINELTSLKLGN